MSYLVDTQIFIWLMEDSKKLPAKIKTLLQDPNDVFISIASVWEIVIKQTKGSLKTPADIEGGIKEAGLKLLGIEISHILGLKNLPLYKNHKDPFDRILISQTKIENLTLITSDPKIWQYKISVVKA